MNRVDVVDLVVDLVDVDLDVDLVDVDLVVPLFLVRPSVWKNVCCYEATIVQFCYYYENQREKTVPMIGLMFQKD